MKKNWFIRILALVVALLMLSFAAVAEEEIAEAPAGYLPERGMSIPFTAEDEAEGYGASYYMLNTAAFPVLPIIEVSWMDNEGLLALFEKYEGVDFEANEDLFIEILIESFSYNHTLYQIALLDTEILNAQYAAGETLESILGEGFTVLTENDGYTYVINDAASTASYDSAELQEKVLSKLARAKEAIDAATYMPVVFAEGELTVVPDAFPAFETVDLAGNTVTNEIFSTKDLTVVNIWGTYCNPCINEMPELAEWSESMPENMQLIGIVSDLNSADDAETLELAQEICEATGADVYTSLVAGDDFTELLNGVVGVPTTFFVDRNGALVGNPVVGADVPGCKAVAESLLSGM